MKFIKSILLTFSIWVLTAILNAVMGGAWLSLASPQVDPWPGNPILVFIFTLIFSVPAVFILWIILLLNWSHSLLFRRMLKAGIILSACSTILLFLIDGETLKHQQLFLSLFIVVSSTTSIMVHHQVIRSVFMNKINNNYV